MSEKPPPRPPPRKHPGASVEDTARRASPPPLPSRPPPSSTAAATSPGGLHRPQAAPPPLPQKDDDGGATKLFTGNLAVEAELVVVQGELKGKVVRLGAGTVVIGRSSECDLVLKAATGVSRRHCKVQYLGNRFVVVDLESRNGTIVNGQSVERKVLENGDRIEVGDEVLQFVVHSLDDVRDVPLADGGIEQQPTHLMPAQTGSFGPPPHVPDRTPAGGGDAPPPLPPSVPPLPSSLPPSPSLPPPEVAPPAVKSVSPAVIAFSVVALLSMAGAAFLVWDMTREPHVVADAGAARAVVDAGAVVAVDAGSAMAVAAVVDAGAVAAVDAGSVTAVATVVDAGVVASVVDAGTGGNVVSPPGPVGEAGSVPAAGVTEIIRATAGGRAAKVLVAVGDRIAVGADLVVLDADTGSLRRKLETLRGEEREFAAAAAKVPSAKADLEAVRAEIRRLEARLRPVSLKADKAGVVVEILVRPGDVVRDRAPIVKLHP